MAAVTNIDYVLRDRPTAPAPLPRPFIWPLGYKLVVPGFNSFEPGPATAPPKPPII